MVQLVGKSARGLYPEALAGVGDDAADHLRIIHAGCPGCYRKVRYDIRTGDHAGQRINFQQTRMAMAIKPQIDAGNIAAL